MKGTDVSGRKSFEETDTKGWGASGNTSRGFAGEIKVAARITIGNPLITLITPLGNQSKASQEAFNILHYGGGRLRAPRGENGAHQLYMGRVGGSRLCWEWWGWTTTRWEREWNVAHLQEAIPAVPPLGSDLGVKRKIAQVLRVKRENNCWEIYTKY